MERKLYTQILNLQSELLDEYKKKYLLTSRNSVWRRSLLLLFCEKNIRVHLIMSSKEQQQKWKKKSRRRTLSICGRYMSKLPIKIASSLQIQFQLMLIKKIFFFLLSHSPMFIKYLRKNFFIFYKFISIHKKNV